MYYWTDRQTDIKQLTGALHDLCEHVLKEFWRNSHDILNSTALIFRWSDWENLWCQNSR